MEDCANYSCGTGERPVNPDGASRFSPLRAGGRVVLLAAVLATGLAGCADTVPIANFRQCQSDLLETGEENKRLQEELAAAQQAGKNLQEQLANLRLTKAPLEQLIYPVKIELERQSGGFTDGRPYDVGLVLYVQPIDKDGDVIKTAGTIDVTLYDLQNPPDQTLIAEYKFDAAKTRSLWYGRMWTHHFSVKCPFPPGKPVHNQVTAKVVFTSLLTGEPLTAQGAYEIKLPPERAAATQAP